MSSSIESLLEGLLQGNALEMEIIKKLKDGLDLIADNMKSECYTRSDALSELREKLAIERAQGHGQMTANEKTVLASIIKMNILKCNDAMARISATSEKTIKALNANHATDKQSLEEAKRKAEDEKKNLNQLADVINGIKNVKAADSLRALMSAWEGRREMLLQEGQHIDKEYGQKCQTELKRDKEQSEAFKWQVQVLKSITMAMGLEETDIQ